MRGAGAGVRESVGRARRRVPGLVEGRDSRTCTRGKRYICIDKIPYSAFVWLASRSLGRSLGREGSGARLRACPAQRPERIRCAEEGAPSSLCRFPARPTSGPPCGLLDEQPRTHPTNTRPSAAASACPLSWEMKVTNPKD